MHLVTLLAYTPETSFQHVCSSWREQYSWFEKKLKNLEVHLFLNCEGCTIKLFRWWNLSMLRNASCNVKLSDGKQVVKTYLNKRNFCQKKKLSLAKTLQMGYWTKHLLLYITHSFFLYQLVILSKHQIVKSPDFPQ